MVRIFSTEHTGMYVGTSLFKYLDRITFIHFSGESYRFNFISVLMGVYRADECSMSGAQ